VPVFYADDVAKNIVDSDPDVRAAIMFNFEICTFDCNESLNPDAKIAINYH